MWRIPISLAEDNRPRLTANVVWLEKGSMILTNFIVDTGAVSVYLGQSDAERLGADYNQLIHSNKTIGGVGGRGESRLLKNALLLIPCEENKTMEASFPELNVLRNPEAEEKVERRKGQVRKIRVPAPNLIGVDFMVEQKATLALDFASRAGTLQIL